MNFKTFPALLAITFLFFIQPNQAQVTRTSKVALQQQWKNLSFQDASLTADNFFDRQQVSMGLTAGTDMQWTKTLTGKNGYAHFRYQQTYQGIPVFGSAYTIHQKNGTATHASGYYLPLIDLSVRPLIDESAAMQSAVQYMRTALYTPENQDHTVSLKENDRPDPGLVIIDRAFPQSSENYALAYEIELTSINPYDKRKYFVDATTGQVLLDIPLLMHQAVPAQGVTKYYGTQSITIDSLSPDQFVLRDPTRNGNTTLNGDLQAWTNTSNNWDLTNENQDEVALDAHYCTQEFHDFMLEKFDWNGLNDEGLPMNVVVHAGNFINAFWNGEYAAFGDGDCHHGPLTTLEVVAHEFMHGVTDYTSDLIYSRESGAINESMSDVFGKALEYYTTPDDFNWNLGASFGQTPYARFFRSFEDPNSKEHPKFYGGEFWEDGGGVHTNSSVGNHWFYQMVNGGSGINEAGEPYDIEPLGMDKAIQIVFLTQKAYLTPSSDYQMYYETSLIAAEEIYGAQAPEIESVREAWKVVGFPNANSSDVLDLSINFITNRTFTCLNNEYFSTEIIVSNVGSLPYDGDDNAILNISADQQIEIPITQNILPGEFITIPLEEVLLVDEPFFSLGAQLEFNDENPFNNNASHFIVNALHSDNDLRILNTAVSDNNCYNNIYELTFGISNVACNPISAGTPIEIQLRTQSNANTRTLNYILPQELLRDEQYQFTEFIDDLEPDIYTVSLLFPDDVDTENNDRLFVLNSPDPIETIYDNAMDFNDQVLRKNNSYYFEEAYLEYNGNNVLAISSFFDERERPVCLEAGETTKNNYFGQSGNFYACADLADMEAPALGFDLTQFRNEINTYPELINNSTVLKISWTSEDDYFEQVIAGQQEGVSEHYEIPLPAQFKGRIDFKFFHNTGLFQSPDYLDYDVSLLDNLSVSENPVSNDDLNTLPLTIHPNPSTGIFSIVHPMVPERLTVSNMQGQVLLRLQQSDDMNRVDLSHLPNSYYLLTIGYGASGQVTKSVIKMER